MTITRRQTWLKLNRYHLFDYYYFNGKIGYSWYSSPRRLHLYKRDKEYYGFICRTMAIRRVNWSKRCEND